MANSLNTTTNYSKALNPNNQQASPQHRPSQVPAVSHPEDPGPSSPDSARALAGTRHLCDSQASTSTIDNPEYNIDAPHFSAYNHSITSARRMGSDNPSLASGRQTQRNNNSKIRHRAPASEETLVLQWNVCGAHPRKAELQQLISRYDPVVIALQELRTPNLQGYVKNFTWFSTPSAYPHTSSAGLGIRHGIPVSQICLNTTLPVCAVTIEIPIKTTILSVYIPNGESLTSLKTELENVIHSLPHPLLIVGDFNAHSTTWGGSRTDHRGIFIEQLSAENALIIMNSLDHTYFHLSNGTTSAIDLSMASASICNRLSWQVENDLCGSDHFPIRVTINGPPNLKTSRPRWLENRADWQLFENTLLKNLPVNTTPTLDRITDAIVEAAEVSIPCTSGNRNRKAVPWWNDQVRELTKDRRKKLRRL